MNKHSLDYSTFLSKNIYYVMKNREEEEEEEELTEK